MEYVPEMHVLSCLFSSSQLRNGGHGYAYTFTVIVQVYDTDPKSIQPRSVELLFLLPFPAFQLPSLCSVSPSPSVADPKLLKRGGRRQFISPELIYRKCTQRSVGLLHGKRRLSGKKIEPIGGAATLNPPLFPSSSFHFCPASFLSISSYESRR